MHSETGYTPAQTLAFYRDVLVSLNQVQVPFLVGGGYALNFYTGLDRSTKDIDLFIKRSDFHFVCSTLADAGYDTELTYPHWLAKTYCQGEAIDLVFSSGNGISEVDDEWFEHAVSAEILGVETCLCPVEEMLWSKAYIMERERYDGADIAHLIMAAGHQLDWQRVVRRFGEHWRLLLSHLTLFGFIYPAQRDQVPKWVMDELLNRLSNEMLQPVPDSNVCGGTLLSREQYLYDIDKRGYRDARAQPYGNLSRHDIAHWTDAIKTKYDHQ